LLLHSGKIHLREIEKEAAIRRKRKATRNKNEPEAFPLVQALLS
jgi:hypothetical protein